MIPVLCTILQDIWKGRHHDTQVCLKVLRIHIPEKARERLLRVSHGRSTELNYILTWRRNFTGKLLYGDNSATLISFPS